VAHVLIGCFLDPGVLFGFLGAFDLVKREVYLWGEGMEPMWLATHGQAAAQRPMTGPFRTHLSMVEAYLAHEHADVIRWLPGHYRPFEKVSYAGEWPCAPASGN
jgi:hypothetical protein